MEKSPQAFRTISEVSEAIEVPAHVLRFWESRFTQIRPVKRGGGRRYYRPEDISLLTAIRELLYTEGFTIRGVQKLLKETGVKALVARYGGADQPADAADIEVPVRPKAKAPEPVTRDLWDDMPEEGLADMPEETAARSPRPPARDPAKLAQIKSVLGRLEALRDRMIEERGK